MPYLVVLERDAVIVQGLPSPVRRSAGAERLPPGGVNSVTVRIGVEFTDDQLEDRGRFFDTDELGMLLDTWVAGLGEAPWTSLFDFRPSYESVTCALFTRWSRSVAQLAFVEIHDRRFGVRTRYLRPGAPVAVVS